MADQEKSSIETISKAVIELQANAKKSEQAFGGMLVASEKIAKVLETKVGHSIGKLLGIKDGFNEIAHNFVQGMTGETKVITAIQSSIDKTKNELVKLKLDAATGTAMDTERYKAAADYLKALESKQTSFKLVQQEISDGMEKVFYAPLILEAWKISLDYATKLNAALIDSDSSTFKRIASMEAIARAQAATGASTEDTLAATKALVARGFQYRAGLSENVALVAKLKEGLGVSEESSSELLSVYSNIKAPIQQAVDGVARIRSETALSAQEAVKYYTEIGRLVNVMNPAGSKFASQNAEYLAGLAGTYKELGGSADDILAMVKHMSSTTGMSMAAMFGATPGFTGKNGGSQQVMENLKTYTDMMLKSAGKNEFARAQMLQVISEQTGASQELLVNLDTVLTNYKNRPKSLTNLDSQWEGQTRNLTDQFARIRDSLHGLLQGGLILPIMALSTLLRLISIPLNMLGKIPGAFYAVGTVIGGAVLIGTWRLTKTMYSLATALYQAAMATKFMTEVSERRAAIDLIAKRGNAGSDYTAGQYEMLVKRAKKLGTRMPTLAVDEAVAGSVGSSKGILGNLRSLPIIEKIIGKLPAAISGFKSGFVSMGLSLVRGFASMAGAIITLPVIIAAAVGAAIAGGFMLYFKYKKHEADARAAKFSSITNAYKLSKSKDEAMRHHIDTIAKYSGKVDSDSVRKNLIAQASTLGIIQGQYLNAKGAAISKDALNSRIKSMVTSEAQNLSSAIAVFDKTHAANLTPSEKKEKEQMLAHLQDILNSNELSRDMLEGLLKAAKVNTDTIKQIEADKQVSEDRDSLMNYQLNPLAGI